MAGNANMKKIGFLVNNLGSCQLAYYLIRNTNKYLESNYLDDVIAFYENISKPCIPMNFAAMQIYEAWNYNGDLIATNIETASKLLSFPSRGKKIFYIWDLEWIRLTSKYFSQMRYLYQNEKLILWARGNTHKELIEDCWNVNVAGVVDDFNMKQIVELCQN
jgi:hypothetical protein